LLTHREIYAGHAEQYEQLVKREDYQGNMLGAITRIVPLAGLQVIDLGAGTGRLAALLEPHVQRVLALDASVPMLKIAQGKLRTLSLDSWLTAAADHRALPLPAASADLMVSGWSVSYVTLWNEGMWQEAAEEWFHEARRVLRKGGQIVLFESLGTGNETPQRLPHLENFYNWRDARGFSSDWIRTDYRFESSEIADELTSFFFGETIKLLIKREPDLILPECTGIWWKHL